MFSRLLLLISLTVLSVSPLYAGEGEAMLKKFLGNLKTLRAELIQTQFDAEGELLDEGQGTLQVERPGKFRLQYHTPYKMLYIADGKRITIFDEDLEQVTIKRQSESLKSTPAQLLSDRDSLEKSFTIKELGKHEGFQWLELKPLSEEANFDYLRLAMEKGALRAMEMVDSFGQTTRLFFTVLDRNTKLDKGVFTFTPPEGVDVIDEENP